MDVSRWSMAALCLAAALVAGCAAQPDARLTETFATGQFGLARQYMKQKVAAAYPLAAATPQKPDRDFLLDQMRLGILTTADGYSPAGLSTWDRVYFVLRQQGLNQDAALAAFLTTEELARVWKGEPFEQALAYHYIGMHYAMQGSWDNARTAYENSLFQLTAVVPSRAGRINTREVLERSAGHDQSFFDHVSKEETDFTLGFLMRGLAAAQMNRQNGDPDRLVEARENFNKTAQLQGDLSDLVRTLGQTGAYNTVFVVEFGRGPQKVGVGMDGAIAAFRALTPSDPRRLIVRAGDGSSAAMPAVCDLNVMAQDHRWNDLQEMRQAKSILGTGLVGAGALTTAYGAGQRSDTAVYAGLGMVLAGAALKATAHADTRYCELLPQRIYVVPLMVSHPGTTVSLEMEGRPESRMVLGGLAPPSGRGAALRHVRLLAPPVAVRAAPAPAWAVSGQVLYSNDHAPGAGDIALPWILGGTCVRTPTEEALADYQKAGFLRDMTPGQLQELYREEGITWTVQDEDGVPGLHVLEGGKSLLAPQPGSAGYCRLFGQSHRSYQPVSARVRQLRDELASRVHASLPASGGIYSR